MTQLKKEINLTRTPFCVAITTLSCRSQKRAIFSLVFWCRVVALPSPDALATTTRSRAWWEVRPLPVTSIHRAGFCVTRHHLPWGSYTCTIQSTCLRSRICAVACPKMRPTCTRFCTWAENRPLCVTSADWTYLNVARPAFNCWSKVRTISSFAKRERIITFSRSCFFSHTATFCAKTECTPVAIVTINRTHLNKAGQLFIRGSKHCAVFTSVLRSWLSACSRPGLCSCSTACGTFTIIWPSTVTAMNGTRIFITIYFL